MVCQVLGLLCCSVIVSMDPWLAATSSTELDSRLLRVPFCFWRCFSPTCYGRWLLWRIWQFLGGKCCAHRGVTEGLKSDGRRTGRGFRKLSRLPKVNWKGELPAGRTRNAPWQVEQIADLSALSLAFLHPFFYSSVHQVRHGELRDIVHVTVQRNERRKRWVSILQDIEPLLFHVPHYDPAGVTVCNLLVHWNEYPLAVYSQRACPVR